MLPFQSSSSWWWKQWAITVALIMIHKRRVGPSYHRCQWYCTSLQGAIFKNHLVITVSSCGWCRCHSKTKIVICYTFRWPWRSGWMLVFDIDRQRVLLWRFMQLLLIVDMGSSLLFVCTRSRTRGGMSFENSVTSKSRHWASIEGEMVWKKSVCSFFMLKTDTDSGTTLFTHSVSMT